MLHEQTTYPSLLLQFYMPRMRCFEAIKKGKAHNKIRFSV